MGVGLMAGQSEGSNKVSMRKRIVIRTDRDRPASPFDRLIVLLQREIGDRFPAAIPNKQSRIVRA